MYDRNYTGRFIVSKDIFQDEDADKCYYCSEMVSYFSVQAFQSSVICAS